jgi:IMP and pyridine-specific 5'-nucleotidase
MASFDNLNLSPRQDNVVRRNYNDVYQRRDAFIDWIKEMLNHSFVLGNNERSYVETMTHMEDLVREHRVKGTSSRLHQLVPSISTFHTDLFLRDAFVMYNDKFAITKRNHIAPTFNEIRHILNLSQLKGLGTNLKFVSFDGDQTLYSDGGNFDEKSELSYQIIELIRNGIIVCVITAASYAFDGSKYEVRLKGLLRRFVTADLTDEEISRFYVMGGECNYLLQCQRAEATKTTFESTDTLDSVSGESMSPLGNKGKVCLVGVPYEVWQAEEFVGAPKPAFWPQDQVDAIINTAYDCFTKARDDLRLRARLIKKPRSVGIIPGGEDMIESVPKGHGSKKLKTEALDEIILRAHAALESLDPPPTVPYCAFNGGRDAWVDVGSKGVAVEALQAYFKIGRDQTLHVGDQFLKTGNDISARDVSACIWITNPKETYKILDYLLDFSLGIGKKEKAAMAASLEKLSSVSPAESPGKCTPVMDVYTGEIKHK